MQENLLSVAVGAAFGISLVLIAAGIAVIFVVFRQKREIAKAYRTSAVLVRYDISEEEDEDGRYVVHTPVWEYEYGGKKREYKGRCSGQEEQEIGTVSEVMITTKGKIYEHDRVSYGAGMVITALGIAMSILAVIVVTN